MLALSGGVDSSTLLFFLARAIGNQSSYVYRSRFQRKGEPELMNFFDKKFHINVEYINARERFISKLKGIDPEQKGKLLVKNLLEYLKKKVRGWDLFRI